MSKEAVVYIHVPFCIEQGPCVPRGSIVAGSETKHRYMQALREEIAGALPLLADYHVPAVYVGGGSPSVMSPDDVSELLKFVRANVNLDRGFELSMELLPQTAGTPSMEGMRVGGVNRVSLLVPSTSDAELASLSCGFELADVDVTMNYLMQFGFRDLDFRVMHGFAGQTEHSFRKTLQTVSAYGPGHVTLLEPPGQAETPGGARDVDWRAVAEEELAGRGYVRYADGCLAKPGRESVYLRKRYGGCDYFGFGLGARTLTEGLVCTNTGNLATYVDNVASYDRIVASVERLSPEQLEEYRALCRARLR